MARPPKSKAIERLKKALDTRSDLRNLQSGSLEFMEWRESTRVSINHTLGGTLENSKIWGIIYNSARTRSLIHPTRLTIEGQSCPETS